MLAKLHTSLKQPGIHSLLWKFLLSQISQYEDRLCPADSSSGREWRGWGWEIPHFAYRHRHTGPRLKNCPLAPIKYAQFPQLDTKRGVWSVFVFQICCWQVLGHTQITQALLHQRVSWKYLIMFNWSWYIICIWNLCSMKFCIIFLFALTPRLIL